MVDTFHQVLKTALAKFSMTPERFHPRLKGVRRQGEIKLGVDVRHGEEII